MTGTQRMAEIADFTGLGAESFVPLFEDGEPQVNHLHLDAGERIEPHRHAARTVLFVVLDGEFELHVGSETYELPAGRVARFDGEREFSPVAVEASTALVILTSVSGGA